MKLHLITAAMKLFFKRPPEVRQLINRKYGDDIMKKKGLGEERRGAEK